MVTDIFTQTPSAPSPLPSKSFLLPCILYINQMLLLQDVFFWHQEKCKESKLKQLILKQVLLNQKNI